MFKKIILAFLIFILIFIGGLIAVPFLFKDRIFETVKRELNKSIQGEVHIDDIHLSILSSFPHLSLQLSNLTIVGDEDFQQDTLCHVKDVFFAVDIKKAVKQNIFDIKSLRIASPDIFLKRNKNGKANWVLAKKQKQEKNVPNIDTSQIPKEAQFNIGLQKIEIKNAQLTYQDEIEDIYVHLKDINHKGKGDFSHTISDYVSSSTIQSINVIHQSTSYAKNISLLLDAIVEIDLKEKKYTLKENTCQINDLHFGVDGSIQKKARGEFIDLKMKAKQVNLKSILSLIPNIYTHNFKDIDAQGRIKLTADVKGIHKGKLFPAFHIDLDVDNGQFKYAHLPTSVDDIKITSKIYSQGGVLDNTKIDIPKLSFSVDQTPVAASLFLKTPVSNPNFDVKMDGKIDLSKIQNYYPMDDIKDLNGVLDVSDMWVKGSMKDIEHKQYEKIHAQGNVLLRDAKLNAATIPHIVYVSKMNMDFNPKSVKLHTLDATVADSKIHIDGSLGNVVGYALSKNGILKGKVHIKADKIKANDWMTNTSSIKKDKPKDKPKQSHSSQAQNENEKVFVVPPNIDIITHTDVGTVIYDDITLKNVTGNLTIKNEEVQLKKLKANLMGGEASISGKYSTKENKITPQTSISYNIRQFKFEQVAQAFSSTEKLAPLLAHLKGTFNSEMQLNTMLNKDMTPNLMSMLGSVKLDVPFAYLKEFPAIKEMQQLTKLSQLKDIELKDVNTIVDIKDGRLHVKPFALNVKDMKMRIKGSNGLDKSMDYQVDIDVPWDKLGNASTFVDNLLTNNPLPWFNRFKPKSVTINLNISGSFDKPIIKVSAFNIKKGEAKEQIKKELKEFGNKQKEEAIKVLDDIIKGKDPKKTIEEKGEQIKNTFEGIFKGWKK